MTPARRGPRQTAAASPALLERINRNAAGIDCGAETHYVAVPPDRAAPPVRAFPTVTGRLHELADWLRACGVTSVAMESTGVYWIPLFEILEARGLAVVLVNARSVKHVPGRTSDVMDCQWLQELHSVGLLRGSFRPTAAIAALRAYLRHRETLVRAAATHVQRMQKALVQMNLRLTLVLSDITGATGLRILRDIVDGQTDPGHLAQHRDPRCQASEAEILAALTGHYRPEHLFVLRQNLELFDAYQRQLAACDAAIEAHVGTLCAQAPARPDPLPAPRIRQKPRANEPRFEIRAPLHQLTGVDLTQIDAIGPSGALRLLGEIGTDMSRWRPPGSWPLLLSLSHRQLTVWPRARRRSAMRSRWSPWISTAPSLMAPPAPQSRLSSAVRASTSRTGSPRITVTTLPFRPPRSRKMRTTPSFGACGPVGAGERAGAGGRMRPSPDE